MESSRAEPGPIHDETRAAELSRVELIGRYRSTCQSLSDILDQVERRLLPGMRTREIDEIVSALVRRYRIASTFKGNSGFPDYVTASVNEEVINTLPSSRRLRPGDLLKLQVGVHETVGSAHQCWTYPIDPVSDRDRELMASAKRALTRAVAQATAGARVRNVTQAIESTLRDDGFTANRDYVGHAMGVRYRERPRIPCYLSEIPDLDTILREDQILTINVIAHAGEPSSHVEADGWNVVADDGTKSVMYSQVVVVRREQPEILLPARAW